MAHNKLTTGQLYHVPRVDDVIGKSDVTKSRSKSPRGLNSLMLRTTRHPTNRLCATFTERLWSSSDTGHCVALKLVNICTGGYKLATNRQNFMEIHLGKVKIAQQSFFGVGLLSDSHCTHDVLRLSHPLITTKHLCL